jgi:hypothetical protein
MTIDSSVEKNRFMADLQAIQVQERYLNACNGDKDKVIYALAKDLVESASLFYKFTLKYEQLLKLYKAEKGGK